MLLLTWLMLLRLAASPASAHVTEVKCMDDHYVLFLMPMAFEDYDAPVPKLGSKGTEASDFEVLHHEVHCDTIALLGGADGMRVLHTNVRNGSACTSFGSFIQQGLRLAYWGWTGHARESWRWKYARPILYLEPRRADGIVLCPEDLALHSTDGDTFAREVSPRENFATAASPDGSFLTFKTQVTYGYCGCALDTFRIDYLYRVPTVNVPNEDTSLDTPTAPIAATLGSALDGPHGSDRVALTVSTPELVGTFPNPCSGPMTAIVTLPREDAVTLDVIDVLGRRVRSVMRGRLSAGQHDLRWDGLSDIGAPVAHGAYFARVQIGDRVMTRPFQIVR